MRKILLTMAAAMALVSCKDTWLMYDTTQKDHIYFQEASQVHTASFALVAEDTMTVSTTVWLMGKVTDTDRRFSVSCIDSCEDKITVGYNDYPVSVATPGTDFTLGELVIPAGETSGRLDITLNRTKAMLDRYVKIGIRLSENENFAPFEADSAKTLAVLSPEFDIYVTDGEPACPSWWKYNNQSTYPLGWTVYLGNFYPAKFRRMLEYFRATEETAPTFYEYIVDVYGVNLEDAPVNFMRTTYASQWAKYVFIPLYNYYVEWYDSHPDDPDYEKMGEANVNINRHIGWADPMSGTYGFLN